MIASLPMYLMPATAEATDRFWALVRDALRANGVSAPDHLTTQIEQMFPHWLSPDLVLSQTCGMPYRTRLHGKVTLVGTPDYGLEGCHPGHYFSVVVARRDDTRAALSDFEGARFAYNEPVSQSGWAALANDAPEVLTGQKLRTGAHRNSAKAVEVGEADFAAIDAQTWMLMKTAGLTKALRIVHRTPPTPGLPLITSKDRDPDPVFRAVASAIGGLSAKDRRCLRLVDLVRIPAEAYLAVPTPPAP